MIKNIKNNSFVFDKNSPTIFFSVIICCYNSENFLEDTINSIISQTYSNWEIIIVDDGSIDNTKKIIDKFINNNTPIKYYYQKNKGFAQARNRGIELCKYDWIVIIDHDDICDRERLKNQLKDIKNHSNCKLFFGDATYFDKNNQFSKFKNLKLKDNYSPCDLDLSKEKSFNYLIKYGCFIVSSTVTFDKNVIRSIGNFNTNYKFVPDYDFFLRISKKFDIYCSNKIISKWRMHQNQSTSKNIMLYHKELNRLLFVLLIFQNMNIGLKFIIVYKLIKNLIKISILKITNVK